MKAYYSILVCSCNRQRRSYEKYQSNNWFWIDRFCPTNAPFGIKNSFFVIMMCAELYSEVSTIKIVMLKNVNNYKTA